MYSIANKIAVVTGGASGIGACIVRQFLHAGAKYVAILDMDEDTGRVFEKELILNDFKNNMEFIKCDVTNDDQLGSIYDGIAKRFGTIDVVVNNAGISNETMSGYKKEVDINVTALISSTCKAIEIMREDRGGKGGTVMNISSVAALVQFSPTAFVYAGTKSAVLYFSNCIGMDEYYQRTKVRVIAMCFGITTTSLLQKYDSFDQNIIKEYKNNDKISSAVKSNRLFQTPEAAAAAVYVSYKNGKSGSTWVVQESVAQDITENVHEAYKIMTNAIGAF